MVTAGEAGVAALGALAVGEATGVTNVLGGGRSGDTGGDGQGPAVDLSGLRALVADQSAALAGLRARAEAGAGASEFVFNLSRPGGVEQATGGLGANQVRQIISETLDETRNTRETTVQTLEDMGISTGGGGGGGGFGGPGATGGGLNPGGEFHLTDLAGQGPLGTGIATGAEFFASTGETLGATGRALGAVGRTSVFRDLSLFGGRNQTSFEAGQSQGEAWARGINDALPGVENTSNGGKVTDRAKAAAQVAASPAATAARAVGGAVNAGSGVSEYEKEKREALKNSGGGTTGGRLRR